MGPIGAFIAGIVTSAEAQIVLPAVSLALILAGLYWMFTRSEHGKEKAMAALMGGALAIMAPSIVTNLSGTVPH
jgi:TrbC/VIRB2 pilin